MEDLYITPVFKYHREQNDYACAKLPEIAEDLGMGRNVLYRFKRKLPKHLSITHVLSDIVYILYVYKTIWAQRILIEYLKSLQLSEKDVYNYFDRFFMYAADYEAPLLIETLDVKHHTVVQ